MAKKKKKDEIEEFAEKLLRKYIRIMKRNERKLKYIG